MKYVKKPVVIEASQWFKNGDHPLDYSATHVGFKNGVLAGYETHKGRYGWAVTFGLLFLAGLKY